jgi:hypothetical protein
MKADIKKKWLKALRSGKYRKARGALRKSTGFCCLGVLTDLYIKETGKGEWGKYQDGDYHFRHETGALPAAVRRWSGIRSEDPHSKVKRKEEHGGGFCSLAILNDGSPDAGIKPHSFKKIADIIERDL